MTELYIPKPGERVRVISVSPEDPMPTLQPGDEVTVDASFEACIEGWAFVNTEENCAGTWCRVEPVEKSEPPKPERRFCACGQEVYFLNPGIDAKCGDCRAHYNKPELLGDDLDRRIADAQPETDEHAFDRPGYSWP